MIIMKRKSLKAIHSLILNRKGVGKLIQMATKLGRSVRPDIKLGICGESRRRSLQALPNSCHRTGLNYVSCSPYRVPIAQTGSCTGGNEMLLGQTINNENMTKLRKAPPGAFLLLHCFW